MVAYPTDSMLTTVTRREVYVSWGVYNIFLTPVHNWIHDCIRYWTREGDPALNMIAVWPNRRQGIIAMWSGGTVGQFRKPIRAEPRQKDEIGNTWVVPKGATPVFPAFPVFLIPRLDPLPVFDGLTIFRKRVTKNTGYACLIPCCGLVTQPHGRLSNRC